MLKYSEHQTKGAMAIRVFFPIKDHLFSDFKILPRQPLRDFKPRKISFQIVFDDVCLAPKNCRAVQCRELTRSAKSGPPRISALRP
jgi:hypothetical protein